MTLNLNDQLARVYKKLHNNVNNYASGCITFLLYYATHFLMSKQAETRHTDFCLICLKSTKRSYFIGNRFTTWFPNETHEKTKMTPTRAPKNRALNYPQKPL